MDELLEGNFSKNKPNSLKFTLLKGPKNKMFKTLNSLKSFEESNDEYRNERSDSVKDSHYYFSSSLPSALRKISDIMNVKPPREQKNGKFNN